MSSQKYYWNPLTNSLEDRDNPSPHVSSKEPTAGAVYTSKLDQVAYPKPGTAPTEIAASKKLSNEERRKKLVSPPHRTKIHKELEARLARFDRRLPPYYISTQIFLTD